jgi:hypothetical protein
MTHPYWGIFFVVIFVLLVLWKDNYAEKFGGALFFNNV